MKGGAGTMAMKVIGKRISEFTDKATGNKVEFGKLYVNYQDSSVTGVQGTIAESISVRPELLTEIPVGSEVTLIYNRYGKVDDFTIKEKKVG